MSMWISKWRVVLKSIRTNVYSSCDHSYWSSYNSEFTYLVGSTLALNGSSYDRYFSEHQKWAWSPYSRFRLNLSPLTGSTMLVNTGPGFQFKQSWTKRSLGPVFTKLFKFMIKIRLKFQIQ